MGMLKVMIMPYVACSRLDRKVSSLSLFLCISIFTFGDCVTRTYVYIYT